MAQVEGFKEVVFSVEDLSVKSFYQDVAGWQITHEGHVDPALKTLWSLPETCTIEEVVFKCPTEDRGFLRLVRFGNVEQTLIRDGLKDSDPGGFFYTHVRTREIEPKLAAIRDRGWQHTGELKEFDFEMFHVKECVSRIHDGVQFSLLQSYRPKIDIPLETEFTSIFNVAQVAEDITATRRFYVDQLGFQVFVETVWDGSEEGMSVLGVDVNSLPEGYKLNTIIVHPQKTNVGSVEILNHEAVPKTNVKQNAVPPNLGFLMVRFPVDDLDGYLQEIQARGVELTSGPIDVDLAPFGTAKVAAVQAPDGAWLEFYQML